MRFTCTVDVDLPIERVVELYDDPANREHWQDGYLRAEPFSGIPGELGAKARLLFRQGKGEMELIETITVRNPPYEFSATYEHEHMVNTMTNRLTSLDAKTTRWEAVLDYTKFNGFMPRLMAMLMPGMFKRQTQKWLDQFKVFSESR